ncbi:MAG: glycine cleavage system protein GcvH [Oligosphaeraceae bacterium]|nr:glycine cleavage system protein GcvH [Oligosphaeraceae bacterium]
MKYYSEDHEWVEVNGEIATIGITKYAAEELGDLTFVELPSVDDSFQAGDILATVESVKAASDVYSPISGVVSEINEVLETEPERVNEDPEGEGWICKFKGLDQEDLDKLMSAEEYEKFLQSL